MRILVTALTLSAALLTAPALAQDATYTAKFMTPETALKAAQGALKACRDAGYQVAVAVVDRSGTPQVMLRDRFAGAHTPSTAEGKAWTSVSFRTGTTAMMGLIKDGSIPEAIGRLPNVVAAGGGMLIEAGGAVVGAIGVSGAPGADADDACAQAGLDAVADDFF